MGDCGVYALHLSEPDTDRLLEELHFGGLLLQHRGYDAYGTAVGGAVFRDQGKIPPLAEYKAKLKELVTGGQDKGVLHVRYATAGDRETLLKNSQPVACGPLVTAHNGQVLNMQECRSLIRGWGMELEGSGDGEIITRVMGHALDSGEDLRGAVEDVYRYVKGGYSVVGTFGDGVFGFRDAHGTKPLHYSVSEKGVAFSSETQNLCGDVREVGPGQLVVSDGRQEQVSDGEEHFCGFELAYFASPSNQFKGRPVWEMRRDLGAKVAEEYSLLLDRCDVVVPIPESGLYSAQGMSDWTAAAGGHKPMHHPIIRNKHVTDRAFMKDEESRGEWVRRKYSFSGDLAGKRVALVDDSIVRGTTLRYISGRLRELGAGELHVFLSFPYLAFPCLHGGIDMATFGQFIANRHRKYGRVDYAGIAEDLGVDSVNYISLEGYREVCGAGLCMACHGGDYPLPEARSLAERARSFDPVVRIYECAP